MFPCGESLSFYYILRPHWTILPTVFNNIIFHEHPKKFDHKSFVAKYMLGLLGCCVSVHPVLLNHRVVTRTWSATNSDILRRWEVIYVLVLILLSKSLIFLNVHCYLFVQYKIEDRYLRKRSNQHLQLGQFSVNPPRLLLLLQAQVWGGSRWADLAVILSHCV